MPKTLYEACQRDHKVNFVVYAQSKKSFGDANIHLKQYEKAVEEGNVQMLLRLGDERLGQSRTKQDEIPNDKAITAILESLRGTIATQSETNPELPGSQ